jgi:sigma-B regulation protein RsbU (phosphoserine phosphatase)
MPAETVVRKPATWQYCILGVLFLITAAYYAKHIAFVTEYVEGKVVRVRAPGDLEDKQPVVSKVEQEGEAAGLRKGDTLLEEDGTPLRSATEVVREVEYARPGDRLPLNVRHKDGTRQKIFVPVVERSHSASDHWLFAVVLHVVLPLSCAALGFGVALLRPRERLAWMLLALLLGFSQIFGLTMEDMDGTLASDLALLYKGACSSTWILWLFLLGVFFPEQLEFGRRHPWLKFLMIVPLALVSVFGLISLMVGLSGYAAETRLNSAVPPGVMHVISALSGTFILAAIVAFFVLITVKYFVASTRDAKRRLRLLYGGMFLALVPTLSLVIASFVLKKGIDDFSKWIELPSLLLTFLFPVTLAYIIVAYRAMDIRVVLRQGLRYTLARRGVVVLQGLLTGGLLIVMARLAQSHATTTGETIGVMSAGIAAIFLMGKGAGRITHWIDRKFFRDSYNAEHLLMELSEQVRTIVEMHPLLETVSRRISESLHVPRVAVLLQGGHPYQLAYALGYDGAPEVEFPEVSSTTRQLKEAKQPTRVYLDDPNNWVNRAQDMSEVERERLAKLNSELLIPLLATERLLGFISLSQKLSEEPYSRTDLQLLGSVAAQTGLALENARLTSAVAEEAAQREAMKREVEIAREVQERLFPQRPPEIEGLDYCGVCRPARGVGGDYYDFLPLPGGRLGVAVGDVSGKGISAALMMASLQASLRGQTMTEAEGLAGVVGRVNQLVYEVSSPERYATFFFAQYDPQSRVLSYVNAGHNPPMVLTRCGEEWTLRRLETGGTVVGLLPGMVYQQDSVQLAAGDVVTAFTDGISEALNNSEEEWGEENLLRTLEQCDGKSAAETVQCIMDSADAFTAGAKQYDDMTVVVIKVSEG